MPELVITLPGLPPTVNHAYRHVAGGGKQRTAAAVAWQAGAILAIRAAAPGAGLQKPTPWGAAIHLVAADVYRWDLDNRVKVLLDALAAGLGLDDRYCTALQVTKARGALAQTTIRVTL